MKKILLIFVAAWIISIGFISCTSVPYSQWNSSSGKIISLVNSPDYSYLSKLTISPFLFDGEIIILKKDIEMIWKNIDEAGFRFDDSTEAQSLPATAADYKLFADTMEVKTWFEKYLPANASIVKIKSDNGLYYMIIGGKKWINTEQEVPHFGYKLGMNSTRMFISFGTGDEIRSVKKSYPAIYGFKGPVK